ncbi:unnamed protein product [Arctia plantaginis]|uniref:Uncharacterized protein n=1 Tax=Arctia plantaginis TaxID=874455 RepID=A0A8S1BJ69_ARCPL|nr:unnamed protein product [Arctia plantaginis]
MNEVDNVTVRRARAHSNSDLYLDESCINRTLDGTVCSMPDMSEDEDTDLIIKLKKQIDDLTTKLCSANGEVGCKNVQTQTNSNIDTTENVAKTCGEQKNTHSRPQMAPQVADLAAAARKHLRRPRPPFWKVPQVSFVPAPHRREGRRCCGPEKKKATLARNDGAPQGARERKRRDGQLPARAPQRGVGLPHAAPPTPQLQLPSQPFGEGSPHRRGELAADPGREDGEFKRAFLGA